MLIEKFTQLRSIHGQTIQNGTIIDLYDSDLLLVSLCSLTGKHNVVLGQQMYTSQFALWVRNDNEICITHFD